MTQLFKKILIYSIVLLGSLSPIGGMLGNNNLEGFGMMTGASPYIKVFGLIDGVEYWALDFDFHLTFDDGSSQQFKGSPELYHKISGNHLLHLFYAIPLSLAPVSSDEYWSAPYRFGLCHGGPLTRDWNIAKPVQEINIEIINKTAGDTRRWKKHISCNE